MADSVLSALSGEQVLQANSLATVTANCVVFKNSALRSQSVIPLSRLSEIETIRKTHPAFLVISGGLSILAAAAFCSKQGDGAGAPSAALAFFSLAGYFGSRRASVRFLVDSETSRTDMGSIRDAAKVVRAIKAAQDGMRQAAIVKTSYKEPKSPFSLRKAS